MNGVTATLDLNGRKLVFDSYYVSKGFFLSGNTKLTVTDTSGNTDIGGEASVQLQAMTSAWSVSDNSQVIIAGGHYTVESKLEEVGDGHLTVIGGIFKLNVNPLRWMPQNYKMRQKLISGQYVWEVSSVTSDETAVWSDANGDGVADESEHRFASLEEVLAVGGDLKLNRDITEEPNFDYSLSINSFACSKPTTLDLNGYGIKLPSRDSDVFAVNSGASLTLKDSKGSGYIDAREMRGIASQDGNNSLAIESGTYYAENDRAFGYYSGVKITGGRFDFNPDINYASDDYVAVQDGNMWGIFPKPNQCTVWIDGTYYYTGNAVVPSKVTVKDPDGAILSEGTDYTLTYENNVEVGTAKVIVTFIGKYRGTKTAEFIIHGFEISNSTNGSIQLPSFGNTETVILTAMLDGTQDVSADTVWTLEGNYAGVEINGNIITVDSTAQKGEVTVKGTYDTAQDTLGFYLVQNALPEAVISENVIYNGEEQKPAVTVEGLTEGKDYTVVYLRGEQTTTDFKNVGTITVEVSGKGTYDGIIYKEYVISPKTLTADEVNVTSSVTYNGDSQKPDVTIKGLTEETDYTVTLQREGTDTSDFTNTGTIKVTVIGIGNYTGSVTENYVIEKFEITDSNVTLSEKTHQSDGEEHKPAVTVIGAKNNVIDEGFDYNIQYTRKGNATDDFTACGTVDITVTGTGNYTGTAAETFTLTHDFDENDICKLCGYGYYYIKYSWNEETSSLSSETVYASDYSITTITKDGPAEWTDGWYIVEDTVSVSSVTVSGDVHLILMDGSQLQTDMIRVNGGDSLTVYGQKEGTGKLNATGSYSGKGATIGGGAGVAAGAITIHGGVIYGGDNNGGASIGSAKRGSGGEITIYHGTVTAVNNSNGGSAIGGGNSNAENCRVTVYGGLITASSSGCTAAIGGYNGIYVAIHGGTITAKGGTRSAGIGGSDGCTKGTVVITGGNIKASAGGGNASGYNIKSQAVGNGAVWRYSGTPVAVGDGKGNSVSLKTFTLDGVTESVEITDITGCDYGINDVYTLDNNKLYFYMPSASSVKSVTVGDVEYVCKSGNTFYTEHVYSGECDDTCDNCGAERETSLKHELNENGLCDNCNGYQPSEWDEDNNVYKIANLGNLLWFRDKVNGGDTKIDAILTENIDARDDAAKKIGIGTNDCPYEGTFDGNNKVLDIAIESTEQCAAPFAYVKGATVKNLTVTGTITSSQKFASSIIALTNGGTVTLEKCISEVVITSTVSGDGTNGGLVANVDGGEMRINNCAFTGAYVTSTATSSGGFIGWTNKEAKAYITNSYIAADFSKAESNGCNTISRNSNYVTIDNCYCLTALGDVPNDATRKSTESFGSGEVAWLLNGASPNGVWKQTLSTDGGDALPNFTGETVYKVTDTCDPDVAASYSNDVHTVPDHIYSDDGFCTRCGGYEPAVPNDGGIYEVSNAGQLFWFAKYVNNGNGKACALLTKDINLKNREWTPIGLYSDSQPDSSYNVSYEGTFDGGYHVIYNLNVRQTNTYETGLFSRTYGATLKNFGVIGATVESTQSIRAGVIAGEIHNSTVTNVFTAGRIKVTTSHDQAGGLAGECVGSNLTNCFTTYGTLCAAAGTLTNCFYMADAANENSVGENKTAEEFASGELVEILNGADDAAWKQNVGKDAYPNFGSENTMLIGDVDGDGILTLKDVKLLKRYLICSANSGEIFEENADVNGDGMISIKDVKMLVQLIVS